MISRTLVLIPRTSALSAATSVLEYFNPESRRRLPSDDLAQDHHTSEPRRLGGSEAIYLSSGRQVGTLRICLRGQKL